MHIQFYCNKYFIILYISISAISILTIIPSAADVGVPGGGKREHAYRHGELPEEEQPGGRQDAPRHPSSAGHHHVVAGNSLRRELFLSFFDYQIFAHALRCCETLS